MPRLTTLAATALGTLALASAANAAYIFTGTPILENFDGLADTNPTGVAISATIGTISALPGTGFDAAKIAGTGTSATALTADNGSRNSGSLYSYGNATGVSPTSVTNENALGSVASGTNAFGFGFQLTNNATVALTSVTVAFTQENWRSSTSQVNTTQASYSTTAAATSYLTSGTFTDIDALDLVGPATVSSNGALDGNLVANQVARTATITGLNIAPGASIFFRWQDSDNTGADAGLAIDNLTISGTLVPEPATLGLLAGVGMLALRRRK